MVTKLNTKEINSLREQLIKLNAAYRMGKPQISDIEYDKLVEKLWQNNPKDKFFEKGIVEKAEDRMEKLPVPMFSLEKVKTLKELRKWLQKMSDAGCKTVIITPKFDGISLVVDESVNDAWTRGDGVMGQKSSLHYKRMNKPIPRSEDVPLYTWGEAILAKRTFTYLKKIAGILIIKMRVTWWQGCLIHQMDIKVLSSILLILFGMGVMNFI